MNQETRYFRPRNWSKFQSRSNTSKAWVKLHITILDDEKINGLTEHQQLIAYKLLALFGRIARPLPWDCGHIARLLSVHYTRIGTALQALERIDFIELCDRTSNLWDELPAPREEKRREEENTDTSLRSVSGAIAPINGTPVDEMSQAIWGAGLRWLIENTGKREDQLRPLLGKWVKILGEGETFERMREMFRAAPADPISWMEQKCNARSGKKSSATATAVAGILGRGS